MVFESLVCDLLNKYLGDYVENLDKSQLKIGIWGGDVILKNLDLKASALDELDLPVKVLTGHLGTLILKIPWKNLYTAPVEAVIENLFIIAGPNAGQKYDDEKENQALQDQKTKALNRIEARKLAEAAKEKGTDKKQGDTFAEKLATQIVKNLQVKISNIHVRYEDFYTTPSKPFAVGVTLDELTFQTVDDQGNQKIIKETVSSILKSVQLNNLALYWNSQTDTYMTGAKENVFQTMKSTIPGRDNRVKHHYLIRPINCLVDLNLVTRPDLADYREPKLVLRLVIQEIGVQFSKAQYRDAMELIQSFERMVLADKYRKYRQLLPAKPTLHNMWHYAYKCVVEEDVRRLHRMWSWVRIKRHREVMRIYKAAYKKRLDNAKKAAEVYKVMEYLYSNSEAEQIEELISQCEKELDVFNIVLVRRQAELEFERQQNVEKKSSGGLFGFLTKKSASKEKGLTDQFAELMTPEEYDKLYKAIDYREGSSDTVLPDQYVAHKLHFELHTLSLSLKDIIDKKERKIISLELTQVSADVDQKPASDSLKVNAKMESFNVHGLPHDSLKPMLVRSLTDHEISTLLDLEVELNPADKSCDQRIRLFARPTEIIYDAATVNHVVQFLKPPEHVKLRELSKAAVSRYKKLKTMSTAGLNSIIDQHKYTEVMVQVAASYILLPETGTYREGKSNLLLIDLGQLKVVSEKDPEAPKKYRAKAVMSKARREGLLDDPEVKDEYLEKVKIKAYDSFTFQLTHFQVIFASQGDDWRAVRETRLSANHIIQPMEYSILLQKCMIADPRLPQIKVAGKLPKVMVTLSDARLLDIMVLLLSVPLPETNLPDIADSIDGVVDGAFNKEFVSDVDTILEENDGDEIAVEKSKVIETATNMTEVDLAFEIEDIEVLLTQMLLGVETPFLKLKLDTIGMSVKVRLFDIVIDSYLGGLYLQHLLCQVPVQMLQWLENQSPTRHRQALQSVEKINLINTPMDDQSRLLSISYIKANNDNPEFGTTYKNTEQKLNVELSYLEVMLHEDALLMIMAYIQNVSRKLSTVTSAEEPIAEKESLSRRRSSSVSEVVEFLGKTATKTALMALNPLDRVSSEIVRFDLSAILKTFEVTICTKSNLITDLLVKGLETKVLMHDKQTLVTASLTDITVFDPEPATLYPKVLCIEGTEVFQASITLYKNATLGKRYADMSQVDTRVKVAVSSLRATFLYRFISQLMRFLDNFEIAKTKALEVGAVAGEMALEAAQSLHAKATRVALDVEIKAPIIVLPSHSRSTSALLLHLGTISVENVFTSIPEAKNKQGVVAVFEIMQIKLTDMQMQRASMNSSKSVPYTSCQILDPINVALKIVRNLAASWYHKQPELDIDCSIPTVKCTLTQEDFTVLMTLLHENLEEGYEPKDPEAVIKPDKSKPQPLPSSHATLPLEPLSPAQEIYDKIKVSFALGSVEAILYSGSSNLMSCNAESESTNSIDRSHANALARFGIIEIKGKLCLVSDTSLETTVTILDCTVDDLRPAYKDGLTKMIERIPTSTDSSSHMVQLQFTQQDNGTKNVDLHLQKLLFIVCLRFIYAVRDFFTKGMPKVEPKQKRAVQEKQEALPDELTHEAISSRNNLTVTFHVNNPEIILVEDTLNARANALILDAGVGFAMELRESTLILKSELIIQLISAHYSVEEKKHYKIAQILAPCSVSLQGQAPEGKGLHLAVTVSSMDLCVSPAVISTIGKIAANLQPTEDEASLTEDVVTNIWLVEKLTNSKFLKLWYLITEPYQDYGSLTAKQDDEDRGEQILLTVQKIVVRLEGGVGNKTIPLLVAELGLNADVRNWSVKLVMISQMVLAISYFNEKLAVWEPFLEPLDDGSPWEISLELKKNDDYFADTEEDESESEIISSQPPVMTLKVASKSSMQIVLSKAGLEMLTSLGKAFGDAYQLVQPSIKAGDIPAPFLIRNETGTTIAVTIDKDLELMNPVQGRVVENEIVLHPSEMLPLIKRDGLKRTISLLKDSQEGQEFDLVIKMLDYESAVREVVIQKALKRCFHLYGHKDPHALIVQTEADLGRRLITIRSNMELRNDLQVPVKVLWQTDEGVVITLSTIDAAQTYFVPMPVVYGKHDSFILMPIVEGVSESHDALQFNLLKKSTDGCKLIRCPYGKSTNTFNVVVHAEALPACLEQTDDMKARCWLLSLRPPFTFHNQLPYKITVQLPDRPAVQIESGEIAPLYSAEAHQTAKVKVIDYLGCDWIFDGLIDEPDKPTLRRLQFLMDGSTDKKMLPLAIQTKNDQSAVLLTLFSPYWFVNRTGIQLVYRDASVKDTDSVNVVHPATYTKPALFSFHKLASSKEKAMMKAGCSKWSDKFPLDAVGSSGTVTCKSDDLACEIGVKVTLSSNGLTKIVECSPYYVVVNDTDTTIRFCEDAVGGADVSVPPGQCLPFWPCSTGKQKKLHLVVDEFSVESKPVLFSSDHSTLLKLAPLTDAEKQKYAVNVTITTSDVAVVIAADDYKTGMEAARIVNCMSETDVLYHQLGSTKFLSLAPGETTLFCWENPLEKRILFWSSGQLKDGKDELVKDGIGEFFADKETNQKLFWVSFLDGMQRVLLFTEDFLQATRAQEAGDFERIDFEVLLSLEGVGLSLIHNDLHQEVAYMGITSSGVVWEEQRKRRWKAFSYQVSEQLEEAAEKYQMLIAAKKEANPIFQTDKLEVDLNLMRQKKPKFRAVRRTFQPGVWLQFKSSKHQTHLHAKINRIQLDNQLTDAVYPVIFSPTPLPKSVAAESVPKPFIEASLVMRKHEHTEVQQIKYLKVLVQEMTLKADLGFLNAFLPLFGEGARSADQLAKEFQLDLEYLNASLADISLGNAQKGHKNFYDTLHFSPLKIHLSFSVTGGKSEDGTRSAIHSEVLQMFLQSLGVALTDVQDVVFRIAYFERTFVFFEASALVHQIQRHYTQQAIKQAYVLVLGLDVLGNPFGLVQGLAEGAKDLFYEPFQGAIQGPEEFAEGLALGLRSLLSGTLGGAAGAVSRITGTLGKGLAAITMDDEYQRKRREKLNKQPENIHEGFARGIKGLGMGFFDGVTGIVRKPVEGAQQEGVEGFFKGLGKGLIGVVARPTGGIIDFAASSFEGIRKATTLSGEVSRIRPPRVLRKDGVITPYNYKEAVGSTLLKETQSGHFKLSDQYVAHVTVTADGRNVLLATDRRVMFIVKGELLGQWDLEWAYEWTNLQEPPSLLEGIQIQIRAKTDKKKEKFSFNPFAKASHGKLIPIGDHKRAEWMVRKMVEAYNHSVAQA